MTTLRIGLTQPPASADARRRIWRDLARPWRATAREGGIYRRRVDDPRSTDRTCV